MKSNAPKASQGSRRHKEAIDAMTMDEMKRQYQLLREEIRRLEAVRAEAIGRGDPVPGRVRFALAEARISAEELRMWGNRQLTRQLREAR